ncbi:MAG: DUF47 family protein [Nitrososphaerota archaeon]|nr:DUF47 family protein [Nitrososphaerota archaeon]
MKNFKRSLIVGEKNIFGELSQIIAIAAEANQNLSNMLDDHKNEAVLERGMQAIKSLERKADDVAFRVNENITAGAVSPNILENLLECVHVADDIVDTYFYQSRELLRMHKSRFPYSEEPKNVQWIKIFKSMLELANQALAKVQQILTNSDLGQILELRIEIETLEQQGDEIKDKSFDILYQEAPHMHYLQFYHYGELVHKFDDILDGCEDLADLVLSTITSILK